MADECVAIRRTMEGTRCTMQGSGDTPDALATNSDEELNGGGGGGGGVGGSNSEAKTKNINYPAQSHIARMPTERHASEYNMNHKYRGRALIFNHEYFDIPSLKPRKGTNVDCENLTEALKRLGFIVVVHKDAKLKKIQKHIEEVASQNHSDNDCIVIAILSHGELGYIYAKDVQYKLNFISHYFTALSCPTLAGKPKIFLIQACQGDHLDPGVVLQKQETETDGDSSMSFKIPLHADFLFAFSTVQGFYSWRNPTNGSWFMQALIAELNENGTKHDILTLLTFVNQRVALDFESYMPDVPMMHQQKQIPCVTSMLTRILRFTEKPNKNG